MSTPEVTIAIPVFNGESLLRTAIESVLAQDFTDLELLIGDNASTDATQQIVEHYARLDPRVRSFRHDENLGGWNNYFFLLANARGRFFSWLAHDDSYETRDHVRKLVEKLREGYVLAFPNVRALHYAADGRVERTDENLLGDFAGAETRYRMSRVSIRRAAHQIYGLFRIETLRAYQTVLTDDRAAMTNFGEGRFVQKLIATERCAFVADVFQNFGLEERRRDNPAVVPRGLIRDYPIYLRRLVAMYWRAPLTLTERLGIYAELARVHVPNFFLVTGMIWKRVLLRTIRTRRTS
jgi:glycosyltransferase involved in cell wall biosynthesis